MTSVDTAWIFDIDGVVTSPTDKRVNESQILFHISSKLKNSQPVAFNTGRSSSWLIERVVNPLLKKIENKKTLRNFIAVLEKGGCWIDFNENGQIQKYYDKSTLVPTSLHGQVKDLVEKKYKSSMFYDSTKETMISVEMIDLYDVMKFKSQQKLLTKELLELIDKNNLKGQLKVDPTTIATDIENKHVGKGFATEKILQLLKKKGIAPKEYIAFGDSPSDIGMAHKLHEKDLPFTFIFVDNKGQLKGRKYPFPIIYTRQRFEKGTLEFLSKH